MPLGAKNSQLSTLNFQLSTLKIRLRIIVPLGAKNFQLSTINYQLSTLLIAQTADNGFVSAHSLAHFNEHLRIQRQVHIYART